MINFMEIVYYVKVNLHLLIINVLKFWIVWYLLIITVLNV